MSATLGAEEIASLYRTAYGSKGAEAAIGPSYLEWLEATTPEWHWRWRWQRYVQEHLNKVTQQKLDRLVIQVPVRHGKSEMVTVRYVAYRLLRDPRLKVILGGYNQTIANRFSRKIRKLIRADYKTHLNPRREAVSEWETLQGGGLRAVGVGAGVTGWGGDLIVVDDPIKNREEADSAAYRKKLWNWWTDDLWTRREPNAQVILIMSRWHRRDLVGRLLDQDGDKWTVVNLPALAGENDPLGREPGEALCPDRYDEEALDDIRGSTTDRTWWSLYQQSPRAGTGAIFSADWWEPEGVRFHLKKLTPDITGRYISLDTAEEDNEENAWTVGVIGELQHDYRLAITNVWRERVAFPELPDEVEALASRWNFDKKLKGVIIEYKSSGVQVYQTLMATGPEWLQELLSPWVPSVSKEMRAEQASVWCRNGCIMLPWPGPEWLPEFKDELLDFPASAYRDQVDAFSQLIIYLEHFIEEGWRGRRAL